jgi:hypothetical protein
MDILDTNTVVDSDRKESEKLQIIKKLKTNFKP